MRVFEERVGTPALECAYERDELGSATRTDHVATLLRRIRLRPLGAGTTVHARQSGPFGRTDTRRHWSARRQDTPSDPKLVGVARTERAGGQVPGNGEGTLGGQRAFRVFRQQADDVTTCHHAE